MKNLDRGSTLASRSSSALKGTIGTLVTPFKALHHWIFRKMYATHENAFTLSGVLGLMAVSLARGSRATRLQGTRLKALDPKDYSR